MWRYKILLILRSSILRDSVKSIFFSIDLLISKLINSTASTFDITGAQRFHRRASVLVDGLGIWS